MERITETDRERILKYFGKDLKELKEEEFKSLQKDARKKYHPDKFAHFEDETVLEMAKERFQEIERLGEKVEAYLAGQASVAGKEDEKGEEAYAYRSDGMRIDIMTQDANLKFVLFRSRYIERGDEVKIKGSRAKLIALEDYYNRSAGFRENIKVHLAFGPDADLVKVTEWLFRHISGNTTSFVIEGKVVKVAPHEILNAIRKEAIKELKA